MEERACWVALSAVEGLSARGTALLLETLGGAAAVWQAPPERLAAVPGLEPRERQALLEARRRIRPAELWRRVQALGLAVVTLADQAYPPLLRAIYDPPPVLYLQGRLPPPEALCVAVVGSRRATVYGKQVAEELGAALSEAGVWVVSGLARGVDGAAHRGALRGGGRTVAVLGCGLDVVYPPEHASLQEEVAARGAVVSEFPPGTPPHQLHFPARNRIISGLSRGVVVVEAAAKSGALITAELALDQGRDVFAVPGPVTSPLSRGTNRLLKEGARLVEEAADVLAEYGVDALLPAREGRGRRALNAGERRLLELLAATPLHLDQLAAETGLPAADLNAALLFLEVEGLVRRLPGHLFVAAGRER